MIPIHLNEGTARLLQRIRWLAWGAIMALATIHLAAALLQRVQSDSPPLEHIAADYGGTCGCPHHPETI